MGNTCSVHTCVHVYVCGHSLSYMYVHVLYIPEQIEDLEVQKSSMEHMCTCTSTCTQVCTCLSMVLGLHNNTLVQYR